MTADDLQILAPCPGRAHGRPCIRGGYRPGSCCASHRRRLESVEDYLFIGGNTMPAAAAAARVGVTERTIQRYRSFLRSLDPPLAPDPRTTTGRNYRYENHRQP